MWDESENLTWNFTGEELELKSKDITIERVGKTGSKMNGMQLSFLVNFFKIIKSMMLSWINIDKNNTGGTIFTAMTIISECNTELRHNLSEQVKEIWQLRKSGKFGC